MYSKFLILRFSQAVVSKPIICELVRQFDLTFNILKATVYPRREGIAVIELSGTRKNFREGIKYLESQVISKIDAQTLVANIHYATGKMLEDTVPYVIEEIDGVKVGLVGLTTAKLKETGNAEGGPVTVEPLQEAAEKYVAEAGEKGADVIVVLMHEGVNTARSIAGSVPGIDIIIAGHDHRKNAEVVKNPDGRETVVVEAGGNANYVGDMAISVDPSSRKVLKVDYRLYSTSGVDPDPEVAGIIAKYKGL